MARMRAAAALFLACAMVVAFVVLCDGDGAVVVEHEGVPPDTVGTINRIMRNIPDKTAVPDMGSKKAVFKKAAFKGAPAKKASSRQEDRKYSLNALPEDFRIGKPPAILRAAKIRDSFEKRDAADAERYFHRQLIAKDAMQDQARHLTLVPNQHVAKAKREMAGWLRQLDTTEGSPSSGPRGPKNATPRSRSNDKPAPEPEPNNSETAPPTATKRPELMAKEVKAAKTQSPKTTATDTVVPERRSGAVVAVQPQPAPGGLLESLQVALIHTRKAVNAPSSRAMEQQEAQKSHEKSVAAHPTPLTAANNKRDENKGMVQKPRPEAVNSVPEKGNTADKQVLLAPASVSGAEHSHDKFLVVKPAPLMVAKHAEADEKTTDVQAVQMTKTLEKTGPSHSAEVAEAVRKSDDAVIKKTRTVSNSQVLSSQDAPALTAQDVKKLESFGSDSSGDFSDPTNDDDMENSLDDEEEKLEKQDRSKTEALNKLMKDPTSRAAREAANGSEDEDGSRVSDFLSEEVAALKKDGQKPPSVHTVLKREEAEQHAAVSVKHLSQPVSAPCKLATGCADPSSDAPSMVASGTEVPLPRKPAVTPAQSHALLRALSGKRREKVVHKVKIQGGLHDRLGEQIEKQAAAQQAAPSGVPESGPAASAASDVFSRLGVGDDDDDVYGQ